MGRLFGSVIAAALAVAACSGTEVSIDGPDVASDAAATAAGRLAVVDPEGNLVVVGPDGSDPVTVALAELTAVSQPTWSPDGRLLAWGETLVEAGFSVTVADIDAERFNRTTVPFGIFFAQWDPTSSRLAVLGPSSSDGVALAIVEADAATPSFLDGGQPYYLSWNGGGDRLLTHSGSELGTIGLDGESESLGEVGSLFQAPTWLTERGELLYARQDATGSVVVAEDQATGEQRDLVAFSGFAFLVAAPGEQQMMLSVVENPQAEIQTASFGGPERVGPGTYLVDLDTGEVVQLTTTPRIGGFFSPDGTRLLTLAGAEQAPFVRWEVWDGAARVFTGAPIVLSPVFAGTYLPFFDQYAQSVQLWSPDGGSFVYPGIDEATGRSAIWVQPVVEGEPAVQVADGVIAVWSPN